MNEVSIYRVYSWNESIGGWDQILETEDESEAKLEYHKQRLAGNRMMLESQVYAE